MCLGANLCAHHVIRISHQHMHSSSIDRSTTSFYAHDSSSQSRGTCTCAAVVFTPSHTSPGISVIWHACWGMHMPKHQQLWCWCTLGQVHADEVDQPIDAVGN